MGGGRGPSITLNVLGSLNADPPEGHPSALHGAQVGKQAAERTASSSVFPRQTTPACSSGSRSPHPHPQAPRVPLGGLPAFLDFILSNICTHSRLSAGSAGVAGKDFAGFARCPNFARLPPACPAPRFFPPVRDEVTSVKVEAVLRLLFVQPLVDLTLGRGTHRDSGADADVSQRAAPEHAGAPAAAAARGAGRVRLNVGAAVRVGDASFPGGGHADPVLRRGPEQVPGWGWAALGSAGALFRPSR